MVEIKERPILMHARSINGIREERKFQTRRLNGLDDVNAHPDAWERFRIGPLAYMAKPRAKGKYGATFTSRPGAIEPGTISICPAICPYGQPGNWLWVRESLEFEGIENRGVWVYAADGEIIEFAADDPRVPAMLSWAHHKETEHCPSIHMPRWASRLTLEITDIRVERVQDISEEDAKAEGVWIANPEATGYYGPRNAFSHLWDDTNGKGAWDRNDWVWAVSFKVVPK